MSPFHRVLLLTIIGTASLMAGCGRKGPLYLPPPPPASSEPMEQPRTATEAEPAPTTPPPPR
jgi:predicted small lipoprotein YifL